MRFLVSEVPLYIDTTANMDTAESMETHGEKGRDETLLPPLSRSGDTSPCRMTGVTLHSHVRYTKNRGPHVAVGWVGGLRRSFPPISYLLVVPCPLSPVSLSPRGESAARGDVSEKESINELGQNRSIGSRVLEQNPTHRV